MVDFANKNEPDRNNILNVFSREEFRSASEKPTPEYRPSSLGGKPTAGSYEIEKFSPHRSKPMKDDGIDVIGFRSVLPQVC